MTSATPRATSLWQCGRHRRASWPCSADPPRSLRTTPAAPHPAQVAQSPSRASSQTGTMYGAALDSALTMSSAASSSSPSACPLPQLARTSLAAASSQLHDVRPYNAPCRKAIWWSSRVSTSSAPFGVLMAAMRLRPLRGLSRFHASSAAAHQPPSKWSVLHSPVPQRGQHP